MGVRNPRPPRAGRGLFDGKAENKRLAFLDDDERAAFWGVKVVHLCLLNENYDAAIRLRGISFAEHWPSTVQAQVLERWREYGHAN